MKGILTFVPRMVKPWNAKQYSNLSLHDEHVFFQNRHEVLVVYTFVSSGTKFGDSPAFPVKLCFNYFRKSWNFAHKKDKCSKFH